MFYSPTTGGFYSSEINGNNMPADAKAVGDDLYQQCAGKHVVPDANGSPSVYIAPAPTHADLTAVALDEIRAQRQPIIGILDGLQSSALSKSDDASALVIETAKQALRDLTSIDLSACDTYEAMRAAVKIRYAQIVRAAPASVALAFANAVQ